jgi:hypothetical protein
LDRHRNSFYGLEFTLTDLLRDSPYATKDPAQADYFYVPALLYFGVERNFVNIVNQVKKVRSRSARSSRLLAGAQTPAGWMAPLASGTAAARIATPWQSLHRC